MGHRTAFLREVGAEMGVPTLALRSYERTGVTPRSANQEESHAREEHRAFADLQGGSSEQGRRANGGSRADGAHRIEAGSVRCAGIEAGRLGEAAGASLERIADA